MKVVLYSAWFLPVSGGVQSHIFELACGLREWHRKTGSEPIEVTVITRTGQTTAQDSSWPFHVVRRPNLAQLFRALREGDLIHIAGPAMLPMALGMLLRKPVALTHHTYQAVCPNGLLLFNTDQTLCPGHFMARHYRQCFRCNLADMGWLGSVRSLILQFPRRWLCKHVSANIAVTDHVARRVALPRTQTIVHGIRDTARGSIEQNGQTIEIGYVGRLIREKGLSVLLNAAKQLRDNGFAFRLTFVGDGPLRNRLEQESRELGLAACTRFTGELAGSDLDRAVGPLQVVVMPSICEETAGLAAIEQMMRGGVVVASDIGGLTEVVGNGGLTFPAGDSNALYARLRELLEKPPALAPLGLAARQRATEKFKLQTMIAEYMAVYESLLHVAKATGPGEMR